MAYTEQPQAVYESLRPYLVQEQIRYETSDCTPVGMTERLLHIEFLDALSEQQKSRINTELDRIHTERQNQAMLRYEAMRQAISRENETLETER